jgi:hypothetical protein
VADSAGHVVGIVAADAADGPLTLRVRDLAPILAALPESGETPVWPAAEGLALGSTVWIGWAGARRWAPALPQATGTPAARQAATNALIGILTAQAEHEGGGRIAAHLPDLLAGIDPPAVIMADAVRRGIAAGLHALHAALQAGDPAAASAALVGLLGLGPGLTPSGDDVVCGVLAGLGWAKNTPTINEYGAINRAATSHRARESALTKPTVAGLAQMVNEAAPTRTNRISAALLRHAATGLLYAPALDLGAALLAGDPAAVSDPARRLLAIGHTSGGDLAVGILFANFIMSTKSVLH